MATIAGCGGGNHHTTTRAELPHLKALSRKCREPEAAITSLLASIPKRGYKLDVYSRPAEAAETLYAVANYLEERKERADCRTLLAVLISIAQRPPKPRRCYRYRAHRLCFVPPHGAASKP
jgi:hypothetical protein